MKKFIKKLKLDLFDGTTVKDLIIPEIYKAYMREYSTEKSELIRSGMAMNTPMMNELAGGSGITFHVPFLKPLYGDTEVMSENPSVPTNMTADQQVGVRLLRIKSWSWSDLSVILSGADPISAFYDQLAQYWDRQNQKTLISILKGLFGPSGDLHVTHLLDVSAKSNPNITAEAILDAKQKLGDNADKLNYIAMHSRTYTSLQKQNLIDYIPNSEGRIKIATFMGYQVVVDDGMPVESPSDPTSSYTTVLYGRGAFSYGIAEPNGLIAIETDRNSLGSATVVVTRQSMVLHPQGFKYDGSVMPLNNTTGLTPSDTDLTGGIYKKVVEDKNIHMVALVHKVDQPLAVA